MRQYVLVTPKDDHGQPKRLFRANFENNVCKAIDQLSGICSGILADGVVTAAEAAFFADFVRKFAVYEQSGLLLIFLNVSNGSLLIRDATKTNKAS